MEDQYSPLGGEREAAQRPARNPFRLAAIAVAVLVNVIGGSIATGRRASDEPVAGFPPATILVDESLYLRRTYYPIITAVVASALLLIAEVIPHSFRYRTDLALRAASAALTVSLSGTLVVHAWYFYEVVGDEDQKVASDALQILGMCGAWLAVALIPGLIMVPGNLDKFLQIPGGIDGVVLAVATIGGAIVGFTLEDVDRDQYGAILSYGVMSLMVAIVGLFGWILMENRWAQLLAIFFGTNVFLIMFPQTFYVYTDDCGADKEKCEATYALLGLGCGLFVLWLAFFGPQDEPSQSSIVQTAVSFAGVLLTAIGAGLIGDENDSMLTDADLVLLVISAVVSFLALFCPLQFFSKRYVAMGFAGGAAALFYVPILIWTARQSDAFHARKGAAGGALAAAGLMLVWLPYMRITRLFKFGEKPILHLVDIAIFLMFAVATIILSVWLGDLPLGAQDGAVFVMPIVSHFLGGCIFLSAVFNLYGTGIWGVFFALIVNVMNQAISGETMIEYDVHRPGFPTAMLHDDKHVAAYALFWIAEVLAVVRLSFDFIAEAVSEKE